MTGHVLSLAGLALTMASVAVGSPAGSAATAEGAAPAVELAVCTQNLWNYGLPEDVKRLRDPAASLASVRERLLRQEEALVERLAVCDIVAVQEVVADRDDRALGALAGLAARLAGKTGRRYAARVAESRDVIRNGFLYREDGPFEPRAFVGDHSGKRLPSIEGYAAIRWDRGPAELLIEVDRGARRKRVRIRVLSAHLKSKRESEALRDASDERWERTRIVQAHALLDLVRRRLRADPDELIIVAGDLNNDRGSATRGVLSGRLDPVALLSPNDCIGPGGALACDLPLREAELIDLAADDPDLRGRGTYRFGKREELIDGILASPRAAERAREAGGRAGDYRIEATGRLRQGSDHRLLRAILRFDLLKKH
jgi:predicted extracellular nuclease